MPRVKEPTPEVKKAEEAERKIQAAIGNTNQEQIDKRNAIADRADEFRAPELQDVDGDRVVEDTEAKAEEEARAAEAERSRLEAEAQEAEAKALQEGGSRDEPARKFTVRVNGRDVEMTEAELLARAAKVSSADEYLQMAQEAVKRSQALAPSQDVSASNVEDVTEDTLTSALQGDREAIRKVAQRLNGPSGIPPDVLQAVDARVAFLGDVNWFRGEYKDVVEDPFLYQLMVAEDKKLAESEPALSSRARLKKAGDAIRTWRQGFSRPSEVNPKLVRKASAPAVPAAGSRQSPPREEEAEEPVENVIDAMAKARGQVQAIRTPQGMFGERKG